MTATLSNNNNERFFPFLSTDLYFSNALESNQFNNSIGFPWEELQFAFPDWNSNPLESDCELPLSPSSSDLDSQLDSISSSPSSSPFQFFEGINEFMEVPSLVSSPESSPCSSHSSKRSHSHVAPESSCKRGPKKMKSEENTKQVTRPKVKEGKGTVQCIGTNRKKGVQCRNAALMEYIGPRPQYCAEHIELDPNSLYVKCKSEYQKEVGDNKGCKEIVLKEFGVCYKHFHDAANDMIRKRDHETAERINNRINQLHSELVRETANAKRKDADLFQRKNKLLPKFQEMKRMANQTVETLSMIQSREQEIISRSTPNTPQDSPIVPIH
eukprot:TRINITY_DN769_c0_g1_i1.p1 TRINITY_DN769_c0_g1~~TRINITY_DN769_c0_g1_i1.p1  ORF type:complete len:327 (+),score=140.26 TRINITY_DN769_c0_g1_i1:556-1536(+)